jgi:hypothetical protein
MGDGGRRRIDAAAARHFLTLLCTRASDGSAAAAPRPVTKGRRAVGAALPFTKPLGRGQRQRGQKPRGALRYSITVTLRRIRIW